MNDIFERMKNGELILESDPEYPKVYQAIMRSMKIVSRLNATYHTPEETRAVISELTGETLDESVWLIPPFHTDFGLFTRFGRRVFVNHSCTFMDRGGITLEDDVFIGPNVSLITENHAENPALRRNVYSRPIVVKQNAWIGAGSTILGGVTIGEHAIVGAGSVVTKDVPPRSISAGVPARFIRNIES